MVPNYEVGAMSYSAWVQSCNSDTAFVCIDAELCDDRHGARDMEDVVKVGVYVFYIGDNVFGCIITVCLLVMSQ